MSVVLSFCGQCGRVTACQCDSIDGQLHYRCRECGRVWLEPVSVVLARVRDALGVSGRRDPC